MPPPSKDLTLFFIYLLLISTIGPLLFGYHLAELNAPSSVITCATKEFTVQSYPPPLPQCIPMSTAEFGLVSSIFTIGGLVGALVAGPAAAQYGRLNTMRYTTGAFAIGPMGEACAPYVSVMATGRFISGLGAGAAVVVVPLYLSEIAPPGKKGFFGSFTQIMVNFGILLASVLGLFLSRDQYWRIILGVGGVIGLIQLTGLSIAVESPKWAADHGRPIMAKQDLQRIRGQGYDLHKEVEGWVSDTAVEQRDEEQSLLNETSPEGSVRSDQAPFRKDLERETIGIFRVLLHPQYNRAVIAVMMVMVAQQFCGINSIVMYGVSLLSDLLEQSAALLNVFVALVNLVVTIACAPLADRIGRKKCLLLSIAGMGLSSLLLGVAILRNIPILSGIVVLTFVGSFGVGLGPVPFILSSELVGSEAVGATQSWALAANWGSTFIVAQFFPVVNEALGKGKVYFIFAALAVVFFTFITFKVPETKDKKNGDEVWGRQARSD